MYEEDRWNEENRTEETAQAGAQEAKSEGETAGAQGGQAVQGGTGAADGNFQGSQSAQGLQNAQNMQGTRPAQPSQGYTAGQGYPGGQPYTRPQGTPDNGNYRQGQPYWQNGNSYGNPYSYNYYQNQGGNQNANRAYNTNPIHNTPAGNGGKPKKPSYGKTAALVTAAALLFGVVAGGTMYGVNRAANALYPVTQASGQDETQESAAAETQISEQTEAKTQEAAGETGTTVMLSDVSPVVEAAMPSVVAITNTQLLQSYGWFGQTQTYEVPSSGSGIIVGENDSELLIVTNNHVIEDANSLTVTFVDGSSVDANLKGTDSETDLAVIAVPLDSISADTKSQITTAKLGDSDALKMGQGVIAIGNALGKGQSVTVGYVSALNREITVDGVKKSVIQTDAAINPGNSGGALLNAAGEVVGINEAKYADASVEGVGYAIPVSDVKDIIDDLMTRTTKKAVSEDEQGYMGVRLRSVDATSAAMYGMPQGAFVYQILDDGPAADSDLREKDIITKINGDTVSSSAALMEMLTYYKAGDTVTLTVEYQENGSYTEHEVSLTLGKRPADDAEETGGSQQ